jgi:hypothetical protein
MRAVPSRLTTALAFAAAALAGAAAYEAPRSFKA